MSRKRFENKAFSPKLSGPRECVNTRPALTIANLSEEVRHMADFSHYGDSITIRNSIQRRCGGAV